MKTGRTANPGRAASPLRSAAWFAAGFCLALPFFCRHGGSGAGTDVSEVPPVSALRESTGLAECGRAGLPPRGKATLVDLFGWREAVALEEAVGGRYAERGREYDYERNGPATRISFFALDGNGGDAGRGTDGSVPEWTLEVDNRTGEILQTPELPDLDGRELSEIALPAHRANPALAKLCADRSALQALLGEPLELRGTTAWDLRPTRVGDRMKFRWSGSFRGEDAGKSRERLVFVYWVDIASRTVVDSAVEVRGRTVVVPD